MSIEKDKYMTPAHSLKTTRSSHSAQYRRHQKYSDALKNQGWGVEPPLVLTGGFNPLKPPRSICQKVVNTGQYDS